MIFPSHRVRIMVATKPIDFRKGHDGLAALVKNELRKDPFTGTVFVFRARKADRLKLLYWDGTGLVMAYKRLEEHSFTWPAVRDGLMVLSHAQFEHCLPGSIGGGSGPSRSARPWRWSDCDRMTRVAVSAGSAHGKPIDRWHA